jgi:large subunit ribosomal protein L30e
MKTGKVALGSKATLKAAAHGRGKLIILARNCPERLKKLIMHYAKLSNIPTHASPLSSRELGVACGKDFMVSALTVMDEGDSDIMRVAEGGEGQYRK